MKATSLINLASLHGGRTVSRAEAIATKMREMGHMPKGGRGPHAPAVNVIQAVAFLLAVAGADRVDDVSDLVTALIELVDEGGNPAIPYLAQQIVTPGGAYAIRAVRVFGSFPMVEVEFRDVAANQTKRFFLPSLWKNSGFEPASQGAAYVGRIGYIGTGILQQLTNDFQDRETGDWEEIGEIVPE